MWIQSDNAPTQYKKKHAFALQQKLADDFNLGIIKTYGAAGHGKGVIDAISSFGVKNIPRKDIVTHDVFFNNSAEIADYLSSINPHYYYTTIPVEDLVKTRHGGHSPIEISGSMKQHLILFNRKKERFADCINKIVSSEEDPEADAGTEEIDIFDGAIDQSEQIFYFATVPSFISLFSGNSVKPLCFVKLISKDVAEMDISDPCGHFVAKGERCFQGYYLKLCRSKDIKVKKFIIIPAKIAVTPDEVYHMRVDINDDLEIDCNIYYAYCKCKVLNNIMGFIR